MTPRDLLNGIDTYLADESQPLDERRALWDVLVALRGPDRRKDRKAMKHGVAGVIRAQAFPLLAARLGDGQPGFRPKFAPEVSLREAAEQLAERGGHYTTHAWRALLALAKWSSPLSRSEP